MKITFRTTLEEREIIGNIPQDKIEMWSERKEFWRIYRAVIKATKNYLNSETPHDSSSKKDCLTCQHDYGFTGDNPRQRCSKCGAMRYGRN